MSSWNAYLKEEAKARGLTYKQAMTDDSVRAKWKSIKADKNESTKTVEDKPKDKPVKHPAKEKESKSDTAEAKPVEVPVGYNTFVRSEAEKRGVKFSEAAKLDEVKAAWKQLKKTGGGKVVKEVVGEGKVKKAPPAKRYERSDSDDEYESDDEPLAKSVIPIDWSAIKLAYNS